MKTASIIASLSRIAGGMFESVRRLHQSLAEFPDLRVTVLGLRDEFTEADLAAWSPLNVRAFATRGPRQFGYAPQLEPALLKQDEDILHVHGIWQYPSLVAKRWHRKTGRPHLISPHGMLDPWAVRNSVWKKRIAHWAYEGEHLHQAACLRALCESEAQAFRAYGLKNPICIVPNGIDLPVEGNAETLKSETLKSASAMPPWAGCVEPGRKVLLFLSRIHPKKGLVNLLKAWAAAQRTEHGGQRAEEWVLAIAGWDQGGHEAELKALATELGIRWADVRGKAETLKTERLKGETADVSMSACQHVSLLFSGPQFGDAKAACYRDCDAFILPSFSEGLPMVVLEAWAYAKPVVMTPECNLPEGFAANAAIRIEHSAEGAGKKLKAETLKAEIDKCGSIEDGLRELFALDDAARLALGANGRSLVASRFTWPKIAAEMKSVYEWVLGGGSKPPSVI